MKPPCELLRLYFSTQTQGEDGLEQSNRKLSLLINVDSSEIGWDINIYNNQ